MLGAGVMLSGCGGSGATQSGAKPPVTMNNVLACTNMDVVFLGQCASKAIARQNAQNAIAFGLEAARPAVRKAARELRVEANASNQTGVNAAIVKFIVARHKLGLGPTDSSGG